MSLFDALLGGIFGGPPRPSWDEQTEWARQAWQQYGGAYQAERDAYERDLARERARFGEGDRYQAYEQSRTQAYQDAVGELDAGEAGQYLRDYQQKEFNRRQSRWQQRVDDAYFTMQNLGEEEMLYGDFGTVQERADYLMGARSDPALQQSARYLTEEADLQTPLMNENMVDFYTQAFGAPQAPVAEDPATTEAAEATARARNAASGRRLSGRDREPSPWI